MKITIEKAIEAGEIAIKIVEANRVLLALENPKRIGHISVELRTENIDYYDTSLVEILRISKDECPEFFNDMKNLIYKHTQQRTVALQSKLDNLLTI